MDEKVQKYFQNPRKLVKVEAREGYILWLTFDNGEERWYSMGEKLQGVFSELHDPEKFCQVYLNEFGNVAWNNRIDICKDALYMDSVLS